MQISAYWNDSFCLAWSEVPASSVCTFTLSVKVEIFHSLLQLARLTLEATMTKRATSSSSFNYQWTYDVFLSFRGEDTRNGFTGNLYHAFCQKGIHTFMDDGELKKGDEITPALFNAIEQSRMAIIVFSKNYASSTFCLNELVKIIQCVKGRGRLVWPIFYGVEPSDVRHQKGNYEQSLAMHKTKLKADEEKMQTWKLALQEAANLSGFHFTLGYGYEYQFIEGIVEEISSKIHRTPLYIANYPVGLETRVLKINRLLGVGSNNKVNMVGICGIGGVGKTTIARAVYNSIADHFEGLCFLHDIKENSSKFGLEQMQERILSKILRMDIKVEDVNEGIAIIRRRLTHKKVLLILDDVDKREQLEKLAGDCDWFGFGSRIVITTRDKQLLKWHGVEAIYNMKEFNEEESLELLSLNAFKSNLIDPSYMEVLRCVVQYAQGLPLALEVIGSHLFGKSIEEWKSALNIYRRIPNKDVQHILQISYHSLQEVEREIFLDITCFFNGNSLEYVKDMVEHAHGFDPNYGIGVLIDKCLIKIENGCIKMHDLIQGMGREIVRQESPREPGKRSRLWSHEDIIHVLESNTGSDKISLIIQEHGHGIVEVNWDGKAFQRMKNLKILSLTKACFSEGPKYLPSSLRVLQWWGYPASCLPTNFDMSKLAILDLRSSCLQSLRPIKWKNINVLNLSECQFVTQIPDVSGIPNLKELNLEVCRNLIEIHDSVGYLERLEILKVGWCKKLRTFPQAIKMPYLRCLELEGCSSLEKFPEILENMKYIEKLDLSDTNLGLPSSYSSEGCMTEGQEEVCSMLSSNSEERRLRECNISDEFLPVFLTLFAHVTYLDLSMNNFTILPDCIKECHFLRKLYLNYCEHLREIRGMPPNIEEFCAGGCISLSSESRSMLLSQELHEAGRKRFFVPGSTLPEWLHHCSRGPSISFWFHDKPPAISLCFVKKQMVIYSPLVFQCLSAELTLNGKESGIGLFKLEDRKFLSYSSLLSDNILMGFHLDIPTPMGKHFLSEWNYVEIRIFSQVLDDSKGASEHEKEIGMHVMNQEMGDIRFTNPYKRTKFNDFNWNSRFKTSKWLSGGGTPTLKEKAEREPSITRNKDRESKPNKKRNLMELYGFFLQTSINEDNSIVERGGIKSFKSRPNKGSIDLSTTLAVMVEPSEINLGVLCSSAVLVSPENGSVDLSRQEANMEDETVSQTKQQENEALINPRILESSENVIKAKDKDIIVNENDSYEKRGDNTLETNDQPIFIGRTITSKRHLLRFGIYSKHIACLMREIYESNYICQLTCRNYEFSSNHKSLSLDAMECEYQVTCQKDSRDQCTNICEKGNDGMVSDQRRDPWLRLMCFNLLTLVASLCSPS